jgi:hypothetical protein
VVSQGDVVFSETAPIGERDSTARKYRTNLGRKRSGLPRDEGSAGFVVEWQLQPLDESEATPAASPTGRLQDLSA